MPELYFLSKIKSKVLCRQMLPTERNDAKTYDHAIRETSSWWLLLFDEDQFFQFTQFGRDSGRMPSVIQSFQKELPPVCSSAFRLPIGASSIAKTLPNTADVFIRGRRRLSVIP